MSAARLHEFIRAARAATVLLVTVAGALLPGCVTSNTVSQAQLPAEWIAAMPKSGAAPADLSGHYVAEAEYFDARTPPGGRPGFRALNEVLPVGGPHLNRARQLTIERSAPGKLRVILRDEGGAPLGEKSFAVSDDPDTGAVVVQRDGPGGIGRDSGALVETSTLRLWRSPDGFLHFRSTSAAVGMFLWAPTLSRGERWGRWAASTPGRIAAVAEREAARGLVPLGQQIPDFTVRDLAGHTLSRDTLAGRFALVHLRSTRTPGWVAESAALKRLHERFHSRGFEIVTVWADKPAERDVVARFVTDHGLTWRHRHPTEPGPDPLRRATRIDVRGGGDLLLDRDGRVLATGLRYAALDEALARLMPPE